MYIIPVRSQTHNCIMGRHQTYLSLCTWTVSPGTPVVPLAPVIPLPGRGERGTPLPSTRDCTWRPPCPLARDSPPGPRVPRACRGRSGGSDSRSTGAGLRLREITGTGREDPALVGPGCRTTGAGSSRLSAHLSCTLGGCTLRRSSGLC